MHALFPLSGNLNRSDPGVEWPTLHHTNSTYRGRCDVNGPRMENEDRLGSRTVIPGLATARARGMRTKPFPPSQLHRQFCLVNAVVALPTPPPLSLVCCLLMLHKNSISSQDDGLVDLLPPETSRLHIHGRKCSCPNFSLARWRASHASRTPFELDVPIYQGPVCPPLALIPP